MKILKIWDADYPWDVRVEKICSSLIDMGHEVHLVCRNKALKKTYELLDGLHIHRLDQIAGHPKMNEWLSFPAFFSPFWIAHTNKIVKKINPDMILVRDLPLCLMAWFVGKINKLPIIFDMAENYPEQCKNVWRRKGFKIRNVFLRNPLLARLVEKLSIRLVDHIWVVIEESKKRLVELGVNKNKITIIRNTPILKKAEYINVPSQEPESLLKYSDYFKIIYIGLIDENRGLQNVVMGMSHLKKKLDKVIFIIVGKGTYEDELRKMAKDIGVDDCVIFEGWIDYKYASYYIEKCQVCVVPHRAIPGWHTTIPNKLFDYMQMGKPVLVTDVLATSRIVNEEKCGVVFKDSDIGNFVEAVGRVTCSKDRKEMGKNGQRAVLEKYNWKFDSEAMRKSLISLR